jgi:hypothetical protein
VARRWLGVLAVVAVIAAAIAAVAVSGHGGKGPAPKPAQFRPSQQFGDDADLMRRLERKKLVKRAQ